MNLIATVNDIPNTSTDSCPSGMVCMETTQMIVLMALVGALALTNLIINWIEYNRE